MDRAGRIADTLVSRGLMKPHFRERPSFIFGCCFDTFDDLERASNVLERLPYDWRKLKGEEGYFEVVPQLIFGIQEHQQLTMCLEIISGEQFSSDTQVSITEDESLQIAQELVSLGFELYGVSGPYE
jgi:hypothetical protein